MKHRHLKLKNRFKLGLIALVLVAVIASGSVSLLALTGLFGGSGSESGDLTRGLVGHWKLDEGTGTSALDSSLNSNTGTLTNGPQWTTGVTERTDGSGGGSALDFDGVDDYIDMGDPATLQLTNNLTISLWVKLNSTQLTAQWADPISHGHSATEGWVFQLDHSVANSNGVLMSNNGAGLYSLSPGTKAQLFDDQWHHLVAVKSSSASIGMEVYRDGVRVANNTSYTNAMVLRAGGNVTIGRDHSTGSARSAKGVIDDVRVYNRALSADEVRRLYNNRGPVAQWKFDEGSGRYAYDSSRKSEDITTGLKAYWSMNDSGVDAEGETITDASGYGNTGTLYGDNGVGDNGTGMNCTATGKSSQGCDFDGVDDYIDIGDQASLDMGTSDVTISVWIKTSTGATYPLIAGKQAGTGSFGYGIYISSDNGFIYWNINDNTDDYRVTSKTDLRDNSWHHIVAVMDRDSELNSKVYVDGVDNTGTKTGTLSSVDSISNTVAFRIAKYVTDTRWFNGSIDELYVFQRALDVDDIKYLYNLGYNNGTLGDATCQAGSGDCPTWSTDNAPTVSGGSLSFDGTNDYVAVEDNNTLDMNNSNAMTVQAWVKPGAASQSNKWIIAKGLWGGDADGDYWLATTPSSNTFRFAVKTATNSYAVDKFVYSVDQWYHLVGIYDGSSVQLYVDGVFQGSTSTAGALGANTNILQIGGDPSANTLFNGNIDDARLYNYVRTADQIRLDYNAGLAARFGGTPDLESGLVGQWKLDEMAGTSAYDSSGQGNTGTLTNSPKWNQGPTTLGLSGGSGALEFDGVDDYVDISMSNEPTTAITVAAWVKLDQAKNWNRFVSHPSWATGGSNSWLLFSDTSNFLFGISEGATQYNGATSTVETGVWHYLIGTYDGSNAKLYVDGVLKNSQAKSGLTFTNSGTNTISSTAGGGGVNTMDGLIDDVRIYNRALTAEEIRYLYNNNGPLAQWKLDEGSGSTAYDSIGSNDGTLTNMEAADWVAGKFGAALDFDGSNEYITRADQGSTDPLRVSGDITVGAWIKPDTLSGTDHVVNKEQGTGGYVLGTTGTNIYVAYSSGTEIEVTGSATLSTGQWQHIAFTYDGANIRTYLNGVLDKVTAKTGYATSSQAFVIGSDNDGGVSAPFDGYIDDVRLYNYVRTQEQLRADYNAGLSAKFGGTPDLQRGLVGHWKFDDMAGTSAKDSSGNSNTGTLTNNPTWAQGAVLSTEYNGLSGGGGALDFDGKNDYVDMGNDASLQDTGNDTLGAWVKWNSGTGVVISKDGGSVGGTDRGRYLAVMNTGVVRTAVAINSTSIAYFDTTNTLSSGVWTHVVRIYNGSSIKVYFNGVDQAGTTTGSVPATQRNATVNLNIGRVPDGTSYFDGSIDDPRIYNRALTAEEIRYLYNNNGPVGHWKLDENAGSTAYDSAGSNDGTLTNMEATDWVAGKFGTALDFDGSNEYITVTDSNTLDTTEAVTISGWIKTGDSYSGTQGYVLRKGSEASGVADYALSVSGSPGYLKFDFNNGGWQAGTVDTSKSVTDNAWHFVSVTYDRSYYTYYVDGVRGDSIAKTTAMAATAQNVYIGNDLTLYHFDGMMDDIRLYRYARTAEQIRADYNAGKSLYFR